MSHSDKAQFPRLTFSTNASQGIVRPVYLYPMIPGDTYRLPTNTRMESLLLRGPPAKRRSSHARLARETDWPKQSEFMCVLRTHSTRTNALLFCTHARHTTPRKKHPKKKLLHWKYPVPKKQKRTRQDKKHYIPQAHPE